MLKVPADNRGEVRLAVAVELGLDGEWIEQAQEELSRSLLIDATRLPATDHLADIRAASRFLNDVMEIAGQLFAASPGEVVVRGHSDVLAHTRSPRR